MDDEAQVRIASRIVLAILMIVAVAVLGLGWARHSVSLAQDQSQELIVKLEVQACKGSPRCATILEKGSLLRAARTACGIVDTDATIKQLCIDSAVSGHLPSVAMEAVAVCNSSSGVTRTKCIEAAEQRGGS